MRYFVCAPKGDQICTLRAYPANAKAKDPYKVWALRSGRQIMFVERECGRLLDRFWLGGSYEQGASYAVSYHEMIAILTDKLGPDDEARYLTEKAELEKLKRELFQQRWGAGVELSWATARFIGSVCWNMMKLLGFALVFPVLLMFFNRQK